MVGAGAAGERECERERSYRGRGISKFSGSGEAVVSHQAISFFGGVDPETGMVREKGHELCGTDITGKVLVFPSGKGSTVGSYVIYQLRKNGHAPAALVNGRCEAIVAVGAIISNIPTVDQIDITKLATGDWVRVEEGGRVVVEA